MAMRQSGIVVHDDPKSISSEAFRMLRTNLQYTSPDKELRSLIVTSAGAGEGKSTVSSNLAAAMAQTGIETCIVGCDVRKPTLHHIFGVPNAPGLTSVLVGQAKLEDAILKLGFQVLAFYLLDQFAKSIGATSIENNERSYQ